MYIQPEPALFGSVNGPVNVAPASRTMVSPGTALFIAVCKLPPAFTTMVLPEGGEYVVSMNACGKVGSCAASPDAGQSDSKAGPNRKAMRMRISVALGSSRHYLTGSNI